MDSHPALFDFKKMETEGQAEIRLIGVSTNLLTLQPEISMVMLIHDVDWWRRVQSGSAGYQLNMPETHEKLLLVPIDSDENTLLALPKNYYLRMLPQAISALWEGIDIARDSIKWENY